MSIIKLLCKNFIKHLITNQLQERQEITKVISYKKL